MPVVDQAVLADAERLAAMDRARRLAPALPMPLDGIARLAARIVRTPMSAVTFVGLRHEYFAGASDLPPRLAAGGRAPIAYSLCKYAIGQDAPVWSGDMAGDDADLREHPMHVEYGVRSFIAVPVRDAADRAVGAVSVMDTAPRRWRDEDVTALLEIAHLLDPLPVPDPRLAAAAVTALDPAGLIESVQEAFVAVDPRGIVVGFNRAAQELLGWQVAEVAGRHITDTVLPDYDDRSIGEALERLFTRPGTRHVPNPVGLRHRDGRRVPTRVLLSVVRGAAGSLACAFITDRTREEAAESEAERQRRFLAALLESLDVGVVAADVDGHIMVMNRALRRVHGIADAWTSAEVERIAAESLHDRDGAPLLPAETPIGRALRGEHVRAADLLIRAADGRERIFVAHAQPITAGDGRRLGAVAALHDVTAMRRAEGFRAREQEIRHILGTAPTVAEAATAVLRTVAAALDWPHAELWLVDAVTDSLEWAGCWSSLAGRPDLHGGPIRKGAGILGTAWATDQPFWAPDATRPVDGSAEAAAGARARARLGLKTALAVPVRDGRTLLGVLICFAAAEERNPDLLTVLLGGVAAQLGLFIARRRAADLAEQLARTRNDFLTLVGHQLRTPLTAITGCAGLLAEEVTGEAAGMARTIERNARALGGVVGDLLDIAGLQSGHLQLAVAEIDLATVVAGAIADAGPAVARSGVRLHTESVRRLGLRGDGGRLRKAVTCLLTNAITYTPRGGDVHVRLEGGPEVAELRVSDTGIGIPDGEHHRLFERFYRASNVAHQGFPGEGLGLAYVQTVAALHHGSITVDTGHRPGASLLLRLPRRGPDPRAGYRMPSTEP